MKAYDKSAPRWICMCFDCNGKPWRRNQKHGDAGAARAEERRLLANAISELVEAES